MAVTFRCEIDFETVKGLVTKHLQAKKELPAKIPDGAIIEVVIPDYPTDKAVGPFTPTVDWPAPQSENTAAPVPPPTPLPNPPREAPGWAEADDVGQDYGERVANGEPTGMAESPNSDAALDRAISRLPGIPDGD